MGLLGKIFGKVKGIFAENNDKQQENKFSYLRVIEDKDISYVRVQGQLDKEKAYKAEFSANPVKKQEKEECHMRARENNGRETWDIYTKNRDYSAIKITPEAYALNLAATIGKFTARLSEQGVTQTALNEYKRFSELVSGLSVSEEAKRNLEDRLGESKDKINDILRARCQSEKEKEKSIEIKRYKAFKQITSLARNYSIQEFARQIKGDAYLYSLVTKRAEKKGIDEESAIKILYKLREKPYLSDYDFNSFQNWFQDYRTSKEKTEAVNIETDEKARWIKEREKSAV